MKTSTTCLLALAALGFVIGPSFASYTLADNLAGFDFYDAFDWEAITDPSNGRVYVVVIPYSGFGLDCF